MAYISGIRLAVQGIPNVARWQVAWQEEAPRAVTSATRGATVHYCGVLDWTATIVCYGHTPTYLPGDSFILQASLDGQRGIWGNAQVQSVRIIADVANQQGIMLAYSLLGDGPLNFGTVSITDTMPPTITCPRHEIFLDDTDLPDVTFWQIVLSRSLPSYVSTSTGGVRKRLSGIFQATVQWRQLLTDATPPAVGSEYKYVVIVVPQQGQNPAKKWTLETIRVTQVEEYGVDATQSLQGNLPEYEITAQFQPVVNGTQQKIIDPSGRQVWPPT